MRIEIEIPKEFEEHFKQDKFEDTLHRLSADAHLIAGRYEQETAIMLIKAFADSKPAYDVEKVAAELETRKELLNIAKISNTQKNVGQNAYNIAIDIVRKGGVE